MTSIDSITISGVRSFDPDPRNSQTIVFRKPLTVILGKNGAGKTTVIESLLHACTGAMPPGSGEKVSFVYDPKVVGKGSVKARIKLNITAVGGAKVSVIRSMEATKKNTKVSFATIDSSIVRTDESGREISESFRAADCDKMVPEFLGVSKAVLEHVVFCHQEDSNWPLQSPADVKAKFDDIFASSQYVAALGELQKVMKAHKQERDQIAVDLKQAEYRREEAQRLKQQIARDEATAQTRYQQAREVDPKIRQISDAIGAIDSIAHNAEQTDRLVATLQGRIEEKEGAARSIAARHRIVQNQSLEQLKQARSTFQTDMQKIQHDCRDAEARLQVNKEAKAKMDATCQQLRIQRELKLQQDRDHKRRVQELQEVLGQVSDHFVVGEGTLDKKALQRVERKLKDDLTAAIDGLNKEKANGEHAVAAAKTEHDGILREMDAGGPERQLCEDIIRTNTRLINDKKTLLAQCIRDGDAILTSANVPSTVAANFAPVPMMMGAAAANNNPDDDTSNSMSVNNTNNTTGNAQRIIQYFESTIADLEQRIAAANATRRAGAWHQEEERLTAELNTVNNTLTQLRAEMSARSEESGITNRLTVIQEQLAAHNAGFAQQLAEAISVLQQAQTAQHQAAQQQQINSNGNADGSSSAPPNITPDGSNLSTVSLAFENLRKNREHDLRTAHDNAQTADRNAAVALEKLDKKREEIADGERRLQQQNAIFKSAQQSLGAAVLGPDTTAESFEKVVQHHQHQLMECKQGISSLVAMRDCYAAFISTAERDHKCEVCDRELTADGLAAFVKSNEDRHKNAPQLLADRKEKSAALEKTIASLKRLEPTVAAIAQLQQSLPNLRAEVQQLTQTYEQLAAINASLFQRKQEADAFYRDAQTFITSYIAALNSRKSEINTLAVQEQAIVAQLARIRQQRETQQRQQAVGGGGGGVNNNANNFSQLTLQAITQQHAASMDQMNALTSRLQDVRRAKLAEETDASADPLSKALQHHQKGLFALGPLVRQCMDVAEEIRVASKSLRDAQERVHNLGQRRAQLQVQLDVARASLEKAQQTAKKRVDAAQIQVATHEKHVQTVEQASAQVQGYFDRDEGGQLNKVRDQLVACEAALEKENAAMVELERQIGDFRRLLDNQNQAQTKIDLTIQYYTNLEEVKEMRQQKAQQEGMLVKLKEDKLRDVAVLLGNRYDPTMSIQMLRSVLQRQHVDLERDKGQHQGALEAAGRAIDAAKEQLSRPDLENADAFYRSHFVKLHTTELVVKDLEKYYTALEKAIQSYHQEKIQQINQLIAEYWRQTYRGSDIDTIEIKAEDETTASGAVNTRKSYKYRLVMRKGNTELDMRGRCSAGQKVLASVVIRLALSEAFCCDCGVLALDEPTTNLDEDNAQSLALALRDLIDARRNTANFQLIVITHDEAFVRSLGGQNVVESYYFVHKDRAGEFSVIEELNYQQE